jgi:hypothetical protein
MILLFLYLTSVIMPRAVYLRPQLLHTTPPNAWRQQVVLVLLQERQRRPAAEVEGSIEIVALNPVVDWLLVERAGPFTSEWGVGGWETKPLSEPEEVGSSWQAFFELFKEVEEAIFDRVCPMDRGLKDTAA